MHKSPRLSVVAAGILAIATWVGQSASASQPSGLSTLTEATCTSSTGPGIPPPSSVPSGNPVFNSSWYGQSGYMTLCPGDTATATLAVYNSGVGGWGEGDPWKAYLGTWNPEPGQDQPSVLGGDGTNGSANTGWPRYNRVAIQPAPYIGPNQVAWFQFRVRAPMTPGTYRLSVRPLVEGPPVGRVSGQWMRDEGIFWQITVPGP